MKDRSKKSLRLFAALFALAAAGCSGTSYQYLDERGETSPKMTVPAGSSAAAVFEFGAPTNYALPLIENDYPTIIAHYSSDAKSADDLQKLDLRLFVEGREIAADETSFEARHFNDSVEFPEAECCARLGERLGLKKKNSAGEYPFGVEIVKKYRSLKRLPPALDVTLTAVTDRGKTERNFTLKLESYEDRGYIRFH
ncbi:MAG: hypothetical protein JSS81_12845 [Acidobacteria bacterium]|nr:hypothetical protein [Acidobacteriota bacterium]